MAVVHRFISPHSCLANFSSSKSATMVYIYTYTYTHTHSFPLSLLLHLLVLDDAREEEVVSSARISAAFLFGLAEGAANEDTRKETLLREGERDSQS